MSGDIMLKVAMHHIILCILLTAALGDNVPKLDEFE